MSERSEPVKPVTQLSGDLPLVTHSLFTKIPARMDRLPWSRWHWWVILSLGISWVLDGLEITLVSVVGSRLTDDGTLGFSESEVGASGSVYIAGAVTGSLFFGYLADRYGRRKLFVVTPTVYLTFTLLTAFSWNFWSFVLFRFFTGLGIGGEYSAMNSAINEMVPARVRGLVDLAVNGSYWLGSALGASASLAILNPGVWPHFGVDSGWRVCFVIGAILGAGIIVLRWYLPESPRWLMLHNRLDEAEHIVKAIEERVSNETRKLLEEPENAIIIRRFENVSFRTIGRLMFTRYRRRSVLGLVLMISQAFFYNAVFFSYALILKNFYNVDSDDTGIYLVPFAVGNFLGSVSLGRFYDTVGRKPMIALTYTLSATLLLITGKLFVEGMLTAVTQTLCWSIVFFFSSAAASSAYLVISEVFPLEFRSLAISFFYSLGTAGGGLLGPVLFGALVESKRRMNLFYGYLVGSSLMFVAALVELALGEKTEQKSLEEIATPVSAEEERPRGRPSSTYDTLSSS